MVQKVIIPEGKHQALITKMAVEQFFGVIETFFEAGKIVLVKKHETLVAPDVDRLIQTV